MKNFRDNYHHPKQFYASTASFFPLVCVSSLRYAPDIDVKGGGVENTNAIRFLKDTERKGERKISTHTFALIRQKENPHMTVEYFLGVCISRFAESMQEYPTGKGATLLCVHECPLLFRHSAKGSVAQ